MRDVKYGMAGHLSHPDLNRIAVQTYEQAGYDFAIWADQTCLTIPRTIWTPDIVPAAAAMDIDAYMEPWPMVTDAAVNTERLGLGITVCDAIRRTPATYAQLALTLDHYSKGRFFLGMGTGEIRHFTPYGVPRNKPFTHLEESVKITKLLMESDGPVTYDGPIWSLKNAVMTIQPYGDRPPPILVAGGGRAMKIAGEHADGWITMQPIGGGPERYSEQVAQVRQYAEAAGRDPDALRFYVLCLGVFAETEDEVEELTHHPLLRWDSVALVTDGRLFNSIGIEHPIRPDYNYARDLVAMDWSREDALAIVDQTPPAAVRLSRFCGTPAQVADQLQPYIEAGADWLNIINYTAFVGSGDFGDAAASQDHLMDTVRLLRERNGQPIPAGMAADQSRVS
jgi:phthiodiolone/phenolphthiodiolone dimycocerosates ketoreductase